MRTLTQAALQSLLAQETGGMMLLLITIDHAELAQPYRFVQDTVDLTHGGETYTAAAFEISLPDETEQGIPEVQLRLDNVDREAMTWLRTVTGPPTVSLELVHKTAAGATSSELGPINFRLTRAPYDAHSVEGVLGYEADYLNEPAVVHRFDPTVAPGLF